MSATNASPRISVAMATYNGARFIPAQLDSIAAQTRIPNELVIGDDGSTDGTADLVAEFARRVEIDVRFTRNESRLGSTQNFVSCLQRCRGDIVLLSDQDDVWHPTRVQRTVDVLEAHPHAAYVFSDADLIDERGGAVAGRLWKSAFFDEHGRRAFLEHRGVDVLLKTNVVTGATMGIRRDKMAAALPVPPGWVHDGWLAFLLELQFGGIPIDEPLIRYRQHTTQQIGVLRMTPTAILNVVKRQDAAFYRKQANNYRALAERISALDSPSARDAADKALRKAACLEARAAFRSTPIRAFGRFLRAVFRGDYDQFGLGKGQAAFDLFAAIASRRGARVE